MGDDDNLTRTSKQRHHTSSHHGVRGRVSIAPCRQGSKLKSLSRVRARRPSYGFTGVAGIRPSERTSQVALELKRPPLIYLPTYQLDPRVSFSIPQVEEIINEILDEEFTEHKYNVQESPALALQVAGEVMRCCKSLQFNRYRIIAVATVGQRRAQSFLNAISFIWDHERDHYVDVHREVTTAFIQVTVFGIYLD